jgi:hypothetical protein
MKWMKIIYSCINSIAIPKIKLLKNELKIVIKTKLVVPWTYNMNIDFVTILKQEHLHLSPILYSPTWT